MIQRKVQCPNCENALTVRSNPGEVVKVTCPSCGFPGKVTFDEQDPIRDILKHKDYILGLPLA